MDSLTVITTRGKRYGLSSIYHLLETPIHFLDMGHFEMNWGSQLISPNIWSDSIRGYFGSLCFWTITRRSEKYTDLGSAGKWSTSLKHIETWEFFNVPKEQSPKVCWTVFFYFCTFSSLLLRAPIRHRCKQAGTSQTIPCVKQKKYPLNVWCTPAIFYDSLDLAFFCMLSHLAVAVMRPRKHDFWQFSHPHHTKYIEIHPKGSDQEIPTSPTYQGISKFFQMCAFFLQ